MKMLRNVMRNQSLMKMKILTMEYVEENGEAWDDPFFNIWCHLEQQTDTWFEYCGDINLVTWMNGVK